MKRIVFGHMKTFTIQKHAKKQQHIQHKKERRQRFSQKPTHEL